MEPTVLPVEVGPDSRSAGRPDDGASGKFISRAAAHNTVLAVVAASVAPILYLLFIDRFATNSFNGDDWSVALLIRAALHGHLSLSLLWSQYNESRLFVGNTIVVLFGLVDRYDLRSVIFFNALLFIASYAVLLALFRQYLRRRLTPIPVLVIGIIWFSLADVQNSLWAFQVPWYLAVFFFVVMLFALLVPDGRRTLWLVVAVLAAVAASLSTDQGFICWPVGAVCVLWVRPWARRALLEIVAWIGAALVAVVLYLPGYNFSENGCVPSSLCSPKIALRHPLAAVRYFVVLIGNVIPGRTSSTQYLFSGRSFARFEAVGVVLLVAAVLIVVQSWRYRSSRERLPLPLLLIGFALVFDATITLARTGESLAGAVENNRYVMPNLILVTGIVIYAWARIPPLRIPPANGRAYLTWLALAALAVFLVVQVTAATGFGIRNGQVTRTTLNDDARFVLNENRVPKQYNLCEEYIVLLFQPGALEHRSFSLWFRDAEEEQLGEFRPSSYRYYRALGPPAVPRMCLKASAGVKRTSTNQPRR